MFEVGAGELDVSVCVCVTQFELDTDGLGLVWAFAQSFTWCCRYKCRRFGFALPHVSEFDSVAELDGNRNAEQVSPPEQPVHPTTASPPACGGTDHKSRG